MGVGGGVAGGPHVRQVLGGVAVGIGVPVGVGIGVGIGVAVGVAVGVGAVGVAVGMGVDPAWATAAQTVAASATIPRVATTKRRIIPFDTVLPPHVRGSNGANRLQAGCDSFNNVYQSLNKRPRLRLIGS